eukprot:TRINITY_DN596_c1_g1_i1.p3 TRINITY_DN596_c1_g1~~TRINITY_DN596_c1_g1_i1.p3  ORF type:complete len:203 (-),score=60.21 TRINITY_DN596_c1_g1_i1:379-987(-)
MKQVLIITVLLTCVCGQGPAASGGSAPTPEGPAPTTGGPAPVPEPEPAVTPAPEPQPEAVPVASAPPAPEPEAAVATADEQAVQAVPAPEPQTVAPPTAVPESTPDSQPAPEQESEDNGYEFVPPPASIYEQDGVSDGVGDTVMIQGLGPEDEFQQQLNDFFQQLADALDGDFAPKLHENPGIFTCTIFIVIFSTYLQLFGV